MSFTFNPVELKDLSGALEEYSLHNAMIQSYREKKKEIVETIIGKLGQERLSKKQFGLLCKLYEKESNEKQAELEILENALEILEKVKDQ